MVEQGLLADLGTVAEAADETEALGGRAAGGMGLGGANEDGERGCRSTMAGAVGKIEAILGLSERSWHYIAAWGTQWQ